MSLRKFVDSKWAWRESGKQKNPRRGFMRRKTSEKAHFGSLLKCCGGKIGREEKLASGKPHGVGAGREKQARKTIPEAYREVAERKLAEKINNQ